MPGKYIFFQHFLKYKKHVVMEKESQHFSTKKKQSKKQLFSIKQFGLREG